MKGGQKQLEQLQSEVASRDSLVENLKREVEAEKAAAEERERQLEANWAQRERQAQAEVAVKVQEKKPRSICWGRTVHQTLRCSHRVRWRWENGTRR